MKTVCLLGAFGSALASLYAVILAVVVFSTQMIIDPATHEAVDAPWWTLFHDIDGVLVFCFLLAVLGFGWLAWRLCRRAFTSSRRGPNNTLQRTTG